MRKTATDSRDLSFKERAQRARRTAQVYTCFCSLTIAAAITSVWLAPEIAKREIEEVSKRTVSIPKSLDLTDVAITAEDGELIVGERGLILMSSQYINKTLENVNSVDSHGGSEIVAVGDDGLFYVFQNSSWSDKTIVTLDDFNGFAYNGGLGVAVGDRGLIAICELTCENVSVKRLESPKKRGKPKLYDVAISEEDVAVAEKDDIKILERDDLVSDVLKGSPLSFPKTVVEPRIEGISFSEDGRFLAAVGRDGLAVIFHRLSEGKKWKGYNKSVEEKNDLNAVAFSDDGKSIMAVGDQGKFYISNFREGRWSDWQIKETVEKDDISAVAFRKNGSIVAVGENGSIFRIENLPHGPIKHSYLKTANAMAERKSDTSPWVELLYANGLRIGLVVVLLFWAQFFNGMIRYHKRLEISYMARHDATEMIESLSLPANERAIHLERAVNALSP